MKIGSLLYGLVLGSEFYLVRSQEECRESTNRVDRPRLDDAV